MSRNWVLALGGAVLFTLGVVFGGFLLKGYFSPASPPSGEPLQQLLSETHVLLDNGQLVEAERNYRAILNRHPGHPEAVTHLGNIAWQRGDTDAALRHYDEALRSDPFHIHALWDKGLALRAKGDDAAAIRLWEAFAQLVPPDSQDAATVRKFISESEGRLAAQLGTTQTIGKSP